ncbi:bifunctional 5,10-methylene-tetrahydrofolate dehydrogenase/5,10-methylene-tetrahydrofolate cyclohydrolase [Candidatus Shapirobacteria bacterium CG03_land_8_20_14_0_80_40_19]|uniref:Bifunctional protein FolD n=4 Tax=Candidatus Shapironibacteriota TaxID=1752721 RepID=A0A2M7BC41_9BACT|nr:MAG: bifunctional 5,10-methylene-tetrahydrofolate dehydrogenase/5,10-methylene-tetrahydrofolate cyclohydrolase [Candidatus Shapirobacteria bacterium CG11_big_fil_rev_8_21_14_0_20_40_12]PIV00671.1 MAG: bifunctional 5,10-methylene-tetrahydrofolate dehydrogenase/5,10-methylene-tetrahydrofolate cyclohydrolase [Candidatus Shapirobacteria bacterium CG03_land_8_20_14_0_80_40_19]PJC29144.1 MAG: bifunctional 5,10-methylene-tetrahydrofolate dehydrogenase/5,10-methylene-tetrahydrofolate cyclohydrolase [C
MTAVIFDGRAFAKEKEDKLVKLLERLPRKPKLVAILVGGSPESELYLKLKQRMAERLGIDFEFKKFPDEKPQKIVGFINQKNADTEVNGIIVELPLPAGFQVLDAIKPSKDVDCLTGENLRLLAEGKPRFIPPTVKAVFDILLKATQVEKLGDLKDKKICVVGDRGMVGGPLVSVLRNSGLEVSGANTGTQDLIATTRSADILISATGIGRLIKKEMVKPGAVVIDVGIEKKRNLGVAGDVDFENVKEIASFITPVPGGVGPVTVVCLMENLIGSVYH